MHDLLQSKRFRSSWALLSHGELRDGDRTAAINGVMRLLATANVDLDDLLRAAVKGCKPGSDAPRNDSAETDPKPRKSGFDNLDIEVNPGPKRSQADFRRAQQAYASVQKSFEDGVPTTLVGIARIDDQKSNPRAAYGVITIVVDNDREFGPMMVYGSDLDAARDSMNRRTKVEGLLKPASNPSHLPTLTEVRMVA